MQMCRWDRLHPEGDRHSAAQRFGVTSDAFEADAAEEVVTRAAVLQKQIAGGRREDGQGGAAATTQRRAVAFHRGEHGAEVRRELGDRSSSAIKSSYPRNSPVMTNLPRLV